MNTRSTKKYQAQNSILMACLILIIVTSSACEPTNFEYQVRVQAQDTGVDLAGAQVRIEVGAQAPLSDVTDADGTARIFIDSSSRQGQPARLTVEISGYKKYEKHIDLRKDVLPTIIQLESGQSPPYPVLTNTPILFPTLAPTDTPSHPTPMSSCPWIPYLNGVPTSSLSDNNCLNDLKGVGISGNEKQVSFFVDGRSSGTYGVCLDISEKDNPEFRVTVRDNIVSARFLVTVGPNPVPASAYGFRFQPEIQPHEQKELYVKFLEYTPNGYDKDMDEIEAISAWKYLADWGFDFVFQFNGSKVNARMNETFAEEWQLTSPNRYLCFAYQATPTAMQSAQLEVHVKFP